jgi:hypothetical protein
MVVARLSLLIFFCFPVVTWTFTGYHLLTISIQKSKADVPVFTRSSTPLSFGVCRTLTYDNSKHLQNPFPVLVWMSTRLYAAPPGGDDDDDGVDDLDDGWEPNEDDILNDLEELDDMDDTANDNEGDMDGLQGTDVDNGGDDEDIISYSDDEDDDDREDEDDDDYDLDALEEEEGEELWEEDDDEDVESDYKEDGIAEESDGDYEYAGAYPDFEWDPDGGLDEEFFDDAIAKVPLRDDPDNPVYNAQKNLVVATVARREKLAEDENFDPIEYMKDGITPEEVDALDKSALHREAERQAAPFMILGPQDVENLNISKELENVSDLFDDYPHISTNVTNYLGTDVNDDDIKALDDAWKEINELVNQENWNKVDLKLEKLDYDLLDDETKGEMGKAIRYIQGASYFYPKWLLYDLDFNVTNLILASVKHNPDAPILLMHWYPQLLTYSRYQYARDRNFDFTHDDVENADLDELKRYYFGFGYDEIPHKAPAETGIIGVEEADDEEIKMAAFEAWMLDVYNPEWDLKDFDHEDIRDEDNVFSDNFEMPNHPDLPTWEDAESDRAAYDEEMGDNLDEENRDFYAKLIDLKPAGENGGYIEDFRGHLVIASGPYDEDLDTAEKITVRMREEFGEKVYVETRVMMHVREDDFVYEVWLESYEIDLLHSRRRNYMQTAGWSGPANVDDAQLEYLVEQVRKLTSEDARMSDRVEEMNIPS